MNKIGNERGTTGFFEDLPALAVTIITVVLFLSMVQSLSTETTSAPTGDLMEKKLSDFISSLRGLKCLTHDGITGLFDAHKVMALNIENISREIKVEYDYRIEILDVSGMYMNYSITVNTSSPIPGQAFKEGMAVGYTTVAIWVSDEEIHAARITITIWK